MRIEFDAGNATELAAISALIAVLRRGEISGPVDLLPPVPMEGNRGEFGTIDSGDNGDSLGSIADDIDPAQAFGGASPVESSAPSGAIASPVPSPGGVDVDGDGLPWDNRIHSTPASKKADGKWRRKRGVADDLVATVSAELKHAMAAPAAPVAPPAPMFEESAPGVPVPPPPPVAEVPAAPLPVAPPVDTVAPPPAVSAETAPAVPAPPAPPAPPVATAPVAPAAPVAGPVTDFAALMKRITGLQTAGKLTIVGTTEIASQLGITGVRDLMHRPDLIPAFDQLLPAAE